MSANPWFDALVAEAYGPLQRYLRRRTDPATADDVMGDVLLVMWRRAGDIPPEAPLPWCYGVARGCLANALRSGERRLTLVRRIAAQPPPTPAPDDPELAGALAALSGVDREVIRLWAWQQLSPAEIGRVLSVSPNAASIRLHRAIKKLRADLVRRNDPRRAGQPVERQGEEAL